MKSFRAAEGKITRLEANTYRLISTVYVTQEKPVNAFKFLLMAAASVHGIYKDEKKIKTRRLLLNTLRDCEQLLDSLDVDGIHARGLRNGRPEIKRSLAELASAEDEHIAQLVANLRVSLRDVLVWEEGSTGN